MRLPGSIRKWLHFPSRIGLMVGLGALSAAGAQADATAAQDNGNLAQNLRIRLEGGQVYISERGSDFRKLPLGDSAETRQFVQLLKSANSSEVEANSREIILAGAGGGGFHWAPANTTDSRGNRGATSPVAPRKPSSPTGIKQPAPEAPTPKTTVGADRQKG